MPYVYDEVSRSSSLDIRVCAYNPYHVTVSGLCSTQMTTLTHLTFQMIQLGLNSTLHFSWLTQLRLNSNSKFTNLTQLRLNSNSKFTNLTQLRLNSFESESSQI